MGPMKPGNRLIYQVRCQFPQDIFILKDEVANKAHLSDGIFYSKIHILNLLIRRRIMNKILFTSESVTEGHPDKICDQISDAILDAILEKDPNGRVACETAVTTGMVLVMGEITTSCYVDIPRIVRQTVEEIGYTRAKYGFDADTCSVLTAIDEQSPDIALGVDKALEAKTNQFDDDGAQTGAGDQGMMFGYACNETPELMPMPIALAHKLTWQLAAVRKQGRVDYLRPDGKSQDTVEYENGKPVRVDTIVISTQHSPDVDHQTIERDMIELVVKPVIPAELLDENTRYLINPTGRFVVGGPQGDSGLTGRKIIVDTYGGYARHGGGAFSGKDPTKVDRSAAYAARYVAKNIVAAGLADKCEIELAYAIGVAKPVSIYVDTFGTNKIPVEKIIELIDKNFDLRPASIIKTLDLRRPIYRQVAAYGHFGRLDLDLPWERTDLADTLREQAMQGK
jgi:S-adenosylmethionine synthetase